MKSLFQFPTLRGLLGIFAFTTAIFGGNFAASSAEKTGDRSSENGKFDREDRLRFHRRLASEFANLDPGDTGWHSEAFTEAAAAQLKGLSKIMLHSEDLNATAFEDILAKEFVCGELKPPRLEPLLVTSSIEVRRGTSDPHPSGRKYRGSEGFTTTLQKMCQQMEGSTDRRANFKIMRVELQSDRVLTRLLFEMSGRKATGWIQVTSSWVCEWMQMNPPRLLSVSVSDYREAVPGHSGRIEFVDSAPAVLAGAKSYREHLAMSFDYWRARSDKSLVADLLGAQGVIVGDVNGDDRDDIYVLQPGGLPNRLFLHQADGSALDISHGSGADVLDFCRSALLVDLDNDGDRDLALGLAWKLLLLENDGTGRFIPRGSYQSEGQVNSMAAADYDNDGDLDIYICGRDASGEMKSQQGALGIPMPYYDANNGGPNTLFRNDLSSKSGSAFFLTDVTKETGLGVNNRRFSLACAWEDFDNDGDQDLYVSNDFGRNNLFRNDGPGKKGVVQFTDVAAAAKVLDIGPGMSAAWGDYNNDGHMDIYVANMWSNAGNRIAFQKQFLLGANEATKEQARRHVRGNSVYLNDGNGAFRDITRKSGANMGRWAWSSNFIDINNDGFQDLVVANGMITAGDSGDL
jgi:hypothetical protein